MTFLRGDVPCSITRFLFSRRTAQLYGVRGGEQARSGSRRSSNFALRAFCEVDNPSWCQGLLGSVYSPSLAEATVYGYTFLRATPRAVLMDESETHVLAFMQFPKAHRTQIHSTKPLERLNAKIKRRTHVVGIFPNDPAIVRLVGALLLEQNDEWQLQRRTCSLKVYRLSATINRLDYRLS